MTGCGLSRARLTGPGRDSHPYSDSRFAHHVQHLYARDAPAVTAAGRRAVERVQLDGDVGQDLAAGVPDADLASTVCRRVQRAAAVGRDHQFAGRAADRVYEVMAWQHSCNLQISRVSP